MGAATDCAVKGAPLPVLALLLAFGLTGCDININVGTGESSTSTEPTSVTTPSSSAGRAALIAQANAACATYVPKIRESARVAAQFGVGGDGAPSLEALYRSEIRSFDLLREGVSGFAASVRRIQPLIGDPPTITSYLRAIAAVETDGRKLDGITAAQGPLGISRSSADAIQGHISKMLAHASTVARQFGMDNCDPTPFVR